MDDIGLSPPDIEDAPRTDRRSGRSQRIEVITRGERRRVWELEQKRGIVLASLQPGTRPSDVARLHGISSGQLYTWRRQMLEGQLGDAPQPAPSFTRVEIATDPPELETPASAGFNGSDGGALAARQIPPPSPPAELRSSPGGLIEIILPGGVCVRVDAQVDSQALRQVLAALEGR